MGARHIDVVHPAERRRLRATAGVSLIEASVRAGVSPPLTRNFELFGEAAVEDPEKRRRLVKLYDTFRPRTGKGA
jgi:hypothetical protein